MGTVEAGTSVAAVVGASFVAVFDSGLDAVIFLVPAGELDDEAESRFGSLVDVSGRSSCALDGPRHGTSLSMICIHLDFRAEEEDAVGLAVLVAERALAVETLEDLSAPLMPDGEAAAEVEGAAAAVVAAVVASSEPPGSKTRFSSAAVVVVLGAMSASGTSPSLLADIEVQQQHEAKYESPSSQPAIAYSRP